MNSLRCGIQNKEQTQTSEGRCSLSVDGVELKRPVWHPHPASSVCLDVQPWQPGGDGATQGASPVRDPGSQQEGGRSSKGRLNVMD